MSLRINKDGFVAPALEYALISYLKDQDKFITLTDNTGYKYNIRKRCIVAVSDSEQQPECNALVWLSDSNPDGLHVVETVEEINNALCEK